jgi:phosphoenolpyruvate-protein kinase (PTS system EI component)
MTVFPEPILSTFSTATMKPEEAAEQIQKACTVISTEMMKILPATSALGNKPVQDEIIKAQYQLTKDVEMIKKLLRRLKNEDQPLL